MKRLASVGLGWVLSASIGGVQGPDRSFKPVTCPAADSLLGAPTGAQRGADLLGWYSVPANRSYIRTDNRLLSEAGIGAAISWAGAGPPIDLAAEVDVSVPGALIPDFGPADSLVIVVDDTLRLELGVPVAPVLNAPRLPRFLPVRAPLQSGTFLSLSRARAATALFRGSRIRLSRDDLAAVNAVFRAASCGAAIPPPS